MDTTGDDQNEGGQIEVAAGTKLDYETKQTYMVTLTAEDSLRRHSASIDVTIMVTDCGRSAENGLRRWRGRVKWLNSRRWA